MSFLSGLFGNKTKRQECVTVPLDGDDNEMTPQEVMSMDDISGVLFRFEGDARDVEVRRTFGQWDCISCRESCTHARKARETIEQWVQLNNE